ncbi:hypothetical protein BU25DRAFT_406198 [Macroventuria anomochaeta]|uniref:Uncharacterized protein n=1 Tax=Macroventuria anomochaeta TaxID=301207 RepID=A0ACB6SHC8_9PLEO|nr:uncharacterized protein BU25DRAFT_406198 [Macroventuria anomochaeta]KAF2632892.1 hypothetical protein BU25DRAFT_406198 [Macroventuria anomochaeta]
MAVIAIISFTAFAATDTTVETLNQTLKASDGTTRFVIGSKVQEPNTIQITSEWPSIRCPTDLTTSPAFVSFTDAIRSATSSTLTTILTTLDKSPFANGAAPIVEYVKSDFLAKDVTPDFERNIEDDFARFETIYRKRGTIKETGEVGLATGWVEEQDGMRSFLVVRGWTAMERFEESLQTEVFKECIPILMSWSAPFKMWHVERKVVSEGS